MKLKTYAGKSLAELVPQIREELGSEAVILKQREVRSGGLGGFFAQRAVEVLAADRLPEADAAADEPATAVESHAVDLADAPPDSTEELLRSAFADALSARLDRLDGEETDAGAEPAATTPDAVAPGPLPQPEVGPVEPARAPAAPVGAGGYTPPLPASRRPAGSSALHVAPPQPLPAAVPVRPLDEQQRDLVLELERAGVSTALAEDLVHEVVLHVLPFSGGRLRAGVRAAIARRIPVARGWRPEGSARRIALVGASGVGKTSCVARLAAGFAGAGLRVGIVVVDPAADERHPLVAALGSDADRLLGYAAGTDLHRVSTPEEACRAQARLAARDVVLVDTPGDGRQVEAVAAVLAATAPHETHLVLPLGLAPAAARTAVDRLPLGDGGRLLVTKTDEVGFPGPLLELAAGLGLPLSYLAEGPAVPGDLVPADGGSIALRILPI